MKQIFFVFLSLALLLSGRALSDYPRTDLVLVDENRALLKTLSLDEIRSLPSSKIITSTIWTQGKQVFEGPSLLTVLEEMGVNEGSVRLSALNDNRVDLHLETLTDQLPILAHSMNGEPMPVRNKGPYWVVFPYDTDIKYQTEWHYAMSIWHLNMIQLQSDSEPLSQ